METIICAAVHYDDGKEYKFQKCYGIKTGFVIGAFRHPYVTDILFLNPKFKSNDCVLSCDNYNVKQGFITSAGRFVDRKEAYDIALKANQINGSKKDSGYLFSEDIYPEQTYNDKGEIIR